MSDAVVVTTGGDEDAGTEAAAEAVEAAAEAVEAAAEAVEAVAEAAEEVAGGESGGNTDVLLSLTERITRLEEQSQDYATVDYVDSRSRFAEEQASTAVAIAVDAAQEVAEDATDEGGDDEVTIVEPDVQVAEEGSRSVGKFFRDLW